MYRLVLFLVLFSSLSAHEGLIILDDIYHTDYLEPGQEIEGCLALMNTSDEPIYVKVYPKDLTFNLKDEALFIEPGVWKRSNTKWVDAKYNFLEIPPFTVCPYKYAVRVPNDPSLQGSYWSVLMFESSEDPQCFISPDGTEIKALKRYAYQIVTQVGNKGVAHLRVMDKRIELFADQKTLALDIENTGTLSLKIKPCLELLDKQGQILGSFSGMHRLIHPLCSSKFEIDVSSAKKGTYRARVILQQEEKNLFSTEYPIEIPDPLSTP